MTHTSSPHPASFRWRIAAALTGLLPLAVLFIAASVGPSPATTVALVVGFAALIVGAPLTAGVLAGKLGLRGWAWALGAPLMMGLPATYLAMRSYVDPQTMAETAAETEAADALRVPRSATPWFAVGCIVMAVGAGVSSMAKKQIEQLDRPSYSPSHSSVGSYGYGSSYRVDERLDSTLAKLQASQAEYDSALREGAKRTETFGTLVLGLGLVLVCVGFSRRRERKRIEAAQAQRAAADFAAASPSHTQPAATQGV